MQHRSIPDPIAGRRIGSVEQGLHFHKALFASGLVSFRNDPSGFVQGAMKITQCSRLISSFLAFGRDQMPGNETEPRFQSRAAPLSP
jgi:hypothetical protein